jgi:AcrR family transcriptional regulator
VDVKRYKVLNLEKKKYHHGDLPGQLIEAVRQLIERDGPDDFKVADAARLAGVSTAAPYRHFANRADLVRHVVIAAMGRMKEGMAQAASSHRAGDPGRVIALGRSYVEFASQEPGMFQVMFSGTSEHVHDPELKALGDETLKVVQLVVAEHLGIEIDAHEARLRAYALWCFVHGHSFLHIDSKLPEQFTDEIEDELLRLVGDAILPERT